MHTQQLPSTTPAGSDLRPDGEGMVPHPFRPTPPRIGSSTHRRAGEAGAGCGAKTWGDGSPRTLVLDPAAARYRGVSAQSSDIHDLEARMRKLERDSLHPYY